MNSLREKLKNVGIVVVRTVAKVVDIENKEKEERRKVREEEREEKRMAALRLKVEHDLNKIEEEEREKEEERIRKHAEYQRALKLGLIQGPYTPGKKWHHNKYANPRQVCVSVTFATSSQVRLDKPCCDFLSTSFPSRLFAVRIVSQFGAPFTETMVGAKLPELLQRISSETKKEASKPLSPVKVKAKSKAKAK